MSYILYSATKVESIPLKTKIFQKFLERPSINFLARRFGIVLITMKYLAAALRTYPEPFRTAVHEHFYLQVPHVRTMFPLRMTDTHVDLGAATAWILDHAGDPLADARLAQLGREHRRHGFPSEIYPLFAESLMAGLKIFAPEPETLEEAGAVLRRACAVLQGAAHAADVAGDIPAHQAQVVAVGRPNRKVSTIRLETALPIEFTPGQHVPVTCDILPGTWRALSFAAPATSTGQLEFHVARVGDASTMLATARVGDNWILGTPSGPAFTPPAEATVVAFGTGWAPIRAWWLATRAANPVIAVADSPGLHYDAVSQHNMQRLGLNLQRYNLAGTDDAFLAASASIAAPVTDVAELARTLADAPVWVTGPEAQVQEFAATHDNCTALPFANDFVADLNKAEGTDNPIDLVP